MNFTSSNYSKQNLKSFSHYNDSLHTVDHDNYLYGTSWVPSFI